MRKKVSDEHIQVLHTLYEAGLITLEEKQEYREKINRMTSFDEREIFLKGIIRGCHTGKE